MSVVPSDSVSRVGESDLPVGPGSSRMVPPSDVFMTTLGESAIKYMDKYFAAYQSYCRASQALASGCPPVSTGSSNVSNSSVGSCLSARSSGSQQVAADGGKSVSRSSLRRFTRKMRASGVSSGLPGGYCYTRAMRPEAREQAARVLGPYPALGDLLSRPREEFMPLTATEDLVISTSDTGTAHVQYVGSGPAASYNKCLVGLSKMSDFDFGTYGRMLRRAPSSFESLPGDFSEFDLDTPIGGYGDPGPKHRLVGVKRFLTVWSDFLRGPSGIKDMPKSLVDSSSAAWQAHLTSGWSGPQSLLLRELGRTAVRSYVASALVRERKDYRQLRERSMRCLDLNVLAAWFDLAFGDSLGYLGIVRKSIVFLDLLGAISLCSLTVQLHKVLDYLRAGGFTSPLDKVVEVRGVASSVSSLLCAPGYCYSSLVKPSRWQAVLSALKEWPTVADLLGRDVDDFHSVESFSYFYVGSGTQRCHLTMEPGGATAYELFASAAYAKVWPPCTLGSVFSRLQPPKLLGYGASVAVGGDDRVRHRVVISELKEGVWIEALRGLSPGTVCEAVGPSSVVVTMDQPSEVWGLDGSYFLRGAPVAVIAQSRSGPLVLDRKTVVVQDQFLVLRDLCAQFQVQCLPSSLLNSSYWLFVGKVENLVRLQASQLWPVCDFRGGAVLMDPSC